MQFLSISRVELKHQIANACEFHATVFLPYLRDNSGKFQKASELLAFLSLRNDDLEIVTNIYKNLSTIV